MELDIIGSRLSNHRLGGVKCASPVEVVAHLGAVQAQDYPAAKWSVGLRTREATDADVEGAFNDGAILRTHVMRPTWHFVIPQAIRPLLALTAARVHAANARAYRELGLDGTVLARAHRVLARSLEGSQHLTRTELGGRLGGSRIRADGRRLAYILMHAELEGLVCSGPRRGRQLTYALLDERAPAAGAFDRDKMLAGWTLRYFRSHGPAQLIDFAWWCGLPLKEAKRGLEMVAEDLAAASVGGATYWFDPRGTSDGRRREGTLLLSIFDEYVIAYRDRRAIAGTRSLESLLSRGNIFTSVFAIDGVIAGGWSRAVGDGRTEITLAPFTALRARHREALAAVARRYAAFLGLRDADLRVDQRPARRTAQIRRPL